jgi:hypothetical protein
MTMQLKTLSWLPLVVALCAAPVWGCGDDDDNGGDDDSVADSGAEDGGGGSDAPDGGGDKADAGDKTDGGGGTKADGGGGSKADAGDDDCKGEDGCYSCADKTTDEQFLNACNDSQSEPYDNAEHIKFELPNGKLWKPGDALPEVP